ncbi:MAG: DMT family transporter [Gemmobacter sp.]
MTDNLRGAGFMVGAMALFALEDAAIKLLAASVPVGQVLAMIGAGGVLIFGSVALARGLPLLSPMLFHPAILARNAGEMFGTMGFVAALALIPLSMATAILQTVPLIATMGAALFLAEKVGWRRWSAIGVGFLGMLVIVRPGGADFDPNVIFAMLGVLGLALRDVATRRVPMTVGWPQLATWGFAATIPAGLVLLSFTGSPVRPSAADWLLLSGGLALGLAAYFCLISANRIGEVSFIAPFRYSRIVFGLGAGMAIFGERLDGWMLAGAALIAAAGLYTFFRERTLSMSGRSR